MNFAATKVSLVLLIGSLGTGVHAFQSNAASNRKPVEATRAHRRLTFKNVSMGEGIDNEATAAGFESLEGGGSVKLALTAFKASDGEGLTVEHGIFRSPDEASRYFHWMIEKPATDILNQASKLDKNGRVIGERAEVVVKLPRASSAIMWTNNQHFFVILSPSLSDAVELEKRYER